MPVRDLEIPVQGAAHEGGSEIDQKIPVVLGEGIGLDSHVFRRRETAGSTVAECRSVIARKSFFGFFYDG